MSHKHLSAFVEELSSGDYTHTVTYDDGSTEECGVFRYIMSLPNLHSASGAYPFDTSPWLLPPKIVDGRAVPNIVTVSNRAEYKSLLKKHGLAEIETPGERRTMYKDRADDGEAKIRADVDEDMKMYNSMLRNPEARKRIIRDNISKSRSLINATGCAIFAFDAIRCD